MIASGTILTKGFLILLFSRLIFTTSADFSDQNSDSDWGDQTIYDDDDGSCGSTTLGDGCSMSDDCSTITCQTNFVNKPITLKLKVNKCDDPVSVTASMDVPDLYISWSHTYTSDDIVEVPGFTASVPGLPISAGVYVQVSLTPNGDKLEITVKLLAGSKVWQDGFYPVKLPVIDGKLPINTNACGILALWYDMNDIERGAVVGGSILLLIIFISCCCCCCGCCGCCKSSPPNQGTVFVQPTVGLGPPVMATSTKTTVPMQPFVNEA